MMTREDIIFAACVGVIAIFVMASILYVFGR